MESARLPIGESHAPIDGAGTCCDAPLDAARPHWVSRAFAAPLLGAIWVYQHTLSPCLPTICRFSPTCSRYAAEALRTRGCIVGGWLALRRLVRCNPLSRGGFDPVP